MENGEAIADMHRAPLLVSTTSGIMHTKLISYPRGADTYWIAERSLKPKRCWKMRLEHLRFWLERAAGIVRAAYRSFSDIVRVSGRPSGGCTGRRAMPSPSKIL